MATLITANRGVHETMSFDRAGFRHRQHFFVYAEILEHLDFDDDDFREGAFVLCEAQRIGGKKHGWWSEVGSSRLPGFTARRSGEFQLSWGAKCEAGVYRIVLRINGRLVAEREVEVTEGVQ